MGGEIPPEIISSPGKLPRGQKSAKTKGYRPLARAPVARRNRRLPVLFAPSVKLPLP